MVCGQNIVKFAHALISTKKQFHEYNKEKKKAKFVEGTDLIRHHLSWVFERQLVLVLPGEFALSGCLCISAPALGS